MDRFDRDMLNSPDLAGKKSKFLQQNSRISKDFDKAVKKIGRDIESPTRNIEAKLKADRTGSPETNSPLMNPKPKDKLLKTNASNKGGLIKINEIN